MSPTTPSLFRAGPAIVVIATLFAGGDAAAANTVETYTLPDLNASVSLPGICRHEIGTQTIDAVCAPDAGGEPPAMLAVAAALVLEVDGERLPPDAAPYDEAEFRVDVAQSVCGEPDPARVAIEDFRISPDRDRRTFTARIRCPEIGFLQLDERLAHVRYVMTPTNRYRLMARGPAEHWPKSAQLRDDFFASFKITEPPPAVTLPPPAPAPLQPTEPAAPVTASPPEKKP
jgi:hypothetical protein